jgi:hypothetical protein
MNRWTTFAPHIDPSCSYAAAVRLLACHDQLAELVERIPGIACDLDLGIDLLAAVINEYDRVTGTASPRYATAVRAYGVMSGTEKTRLRLLAFFATERVGLRVSDLTGLDTQGQRLLADWCTAIQAV